MALKAGPEDVHLVLRGVPQSLWSYPITSQPQIIGRQASCPIRVGDRSVSREHAEVWQDDQIAYIRDLRSSNGTRVNDAVVDQQALRIGDVVRLGEIVMDVRGPEANEVSGLTSQTTFVVPDQRLGIDLCGLRPDRLPLREEVAALYSLGGTLGNCSRRSEVLKGFVDWLREWLGVMLAAVILRTKEGLKVEALSAPPGSGTSGYLYWPAIRECFGRGSTVSCAVQAEKATADDARQVLAVWLPDAKPAAVIYAEWPEAALNQQEGYPELVAAASQVLASALNQLGASRPAKPQRGSEFVQQNLVIKGGDAMAPIFNLIRQAAAVDATVLITGETGTGKELVARAIHQTSPRSAGPFIARNCGAFPESLFENELFGHEPGAFTGATRRHLGVFEQADGGTLFLDEIGEIPLYLQSKLLRVMEEQTLQRIGGHESLQVNVRVIAATNRNLAESVKAGEFRQDLYYRLQVLNIHLPPLRERAGDIKRLALHFVASACRRMGVPEVIITEPALAKLETHSWPGNVRELRNTMERAVILCEGPEIGIDQIILTENPGASKPIKSSATISLDDMERQHIHKVLASVGGNKAKAASILGIDRTTLHRKLRRLNQGPGN